MKKIGNGQESRVLEHYRTGMKKNPGFWTVTGRERGRIPGSGALPGGNEEESRVLEHYRTGTDKNPRFWSITKTEINKKQVIIFPPRRPASERNRRLK